MSIIEIIKKIFNFSKNSKVNKDLKIICKDNKTIEDYSVYPTENEYEENVNDIRRKELKSERFIKTKEFIHNYYTRGNLELEVELFKIVGSYGLDDDLLGKEYKNIKKRKENRYKKLEKFLNSLTEEDINSNIYLKAATTFMKTSSEDCNIIIKQLESEMSSLELSDKWQKIEINIDIPDEKLDLFPERISEETGIPYYRPQDYKVSYINLLDEYNQYVYREYNDYVRKNDKLANDIYHLQMWNLLSQLSIDVNSYHFSIMNNSFEHKFNVSFFVRESNKSKLDYDLRVMIDGIPLDRENILLMKEVNNEFDKLSDNPKVIVKVKK